MSLLISQQVAEKVVEIIATCTDEYYWEDMVAKANESLEIEGGFVFVTDFAHYEVRLG